MNVSASHARHIGAAVAARSLDPRVCEPAMHDILRLLAGGPVPRYVGSDDYGKYRAAVLAAMAATAAAGAAAAQQAAPEAGAAVSAVVLVQRR